jgi:prophage regulatory protein
MQLVHSAGPAIKRDRLLAMPEVTNLVGLKKSSLYKLMQAGEFPAGIQLAPRTVRWSEAAVLSWVQDRIRSASGQSNLSGL